MFNLNNKYLACLLSATFALGSRAAHADISAAARAFADGQAAQLERNYERAAQSYELAYDIAPSREALRSAVRARQQANQLPRAATLAALLVTQYGDDATSARLANDVIAEARSRLGRISVACPSRCTLAVGGRASSLRAAPIQVVFAVPGHQVLTISFQGDRSVTRELTLQPGDDVTLPVEPPSATPAATATKPAPTRPSRPPIPHGGLSPYWTIAGAVVTLGLVGATTWSGLDTQAARDAYARAPTHDAYVAGRSKQLRTDLLLGGTIAAAAATTLVGALWTHWGGDDDPTDHGMVVVPENGGATLSFSGKF